ncbi:UDP-3-O-(3-hydroxymyristoyl)glucosamine N-acyltransferase [Aureimonas sp. AU12]|uniref:UDP-3-O-(3-hydroxymyristoyl)glucosamine N-acyltransferase n=1 Tax=Aureimonas sp. AU12 TaxID=1638161 RepID=UPI0007840BB0|nr:UDP-3-O-(3-hydroxymyristoyl)glucosamine N-acyltransferase [Aureimonas sp. AU12]
MTDRSFFKRGEGVTLAALALACEATLLDASYSEVRIRGIRALGEAGADDVALFDNPNYAATLATSQTGAVLTSARYAPQVPLGTPVLVAKEPQIAFARAGWLLHPAAIRPGSDFAEGFISPQASIDPSARIEEGATIEPFVRIGPDVEIGRGSIVASGASIGAGCRIGRNVRIGQQVSIQHALIGNDVILHPGVRIGQDGFGYAIGSVGILKMVQVGRVILQDNVEVGANSTIDRGAVRDTVVGENTKIDNLVQIAHNVVIGRNCIIVGQVGIAGSATIGNGVAIGGQSGVNGHITIGDGAQVAAVSTVATDMPAGARWGGTPARPVREWIREMAVLKGLTQTGRGSKRDDG